MLLPLQQPIGIAHRLEVLNHFMVIVYEILVS
jgi:hypothetical protein